MGPLVVGQFSMKWFYLSGIYWVLQYSHPAFESGHLKQGYVGRSHMVKIDTGVDPAMITD